ncbi:MAG: hypothetical protein KAH84_07235, partial [Thiomargarita sp.]|nr:hypothetical protein [Thiomargarita sp.]
LEKIVEEKLRSIFYGNPIDAFIKYNKDCTSHRDGKLRLKLNNILNNNCKIELKLYAEMVGRRNAIVHNAGIIDSKYVREVGVKRLSLGDKVKINDTYLFDSLKALDTIAKFYIEQVFCTIGIDEKPKNAKL